ncbi:DUF1513 domain-containing protein [Cribrihabitans pelagius]|uniref:DUF1513 domain-containing protein n=1 Tax=Cribrihabitans pelagius TaxID=1765746 RepID=UPI003B5A7116
MNSRRTFLAGLLATGLAPQASWADAGAPAFLSAGRDEQGRFLLAGLTRDGRALFRPPLPARGHAAAAHPARPEAVAFARRPGRFANVIDCRSGAALARLEPPAGHHFFGHGTFSADGRFLYTTENAYETSRGRIGVWDTRKGYRRIGAFASGGTGPHDILLRRDAPGLVVANGGIRTHPGSGRAKLNLATMRPNLSYLSSGGTLDAQMELPAALHQNSIRHLAMRADGTVGFAMQWQGGAGELVPIAGLHRPGTPPRLMADGDPRVLNLQGYGGSIAFSPDGTRVAVTSPRGGVLQVMDCAGGELLAEHRMADVCGLAPGPANAGFTASTGTGALFEITHAGPRLLHRTALAWDNHLIPLV